MAHEHQHLVRPRQQRPHPLGAAADDARCVGWARDFFTTMAPHAIGSVYGNFMPDEYDPKNFFRLNQNIQPASV
jgi:hypothetical protein